ncbi:N-6 DNA methylase [Nocardiopsis sp. CA-288880]|uniref:N-6 DNA methylase n=1 Tax=Nocardiopsis sp. CA-288880 TaxID=3239995 RepID=UPI003D9945E4
MVETSQVTAADIARIAQVSRTTVSNWRRRHGNFPQPVGGSGNRSLFDRAQVEAWLAGGGRLPEREPHERVWERVRAVAARGGDLGDVVAGVQEMLLRLFRGGAAGPPRDGTAAAGMAGEATGDAVQARLAAHPDGPGLIHAVREAAPTPERARELSEHLHDAYLAALGGKAHITPEPLSRLMADLAGVRGAEVFDPACGTGTLLRTAAEEGAVGLYGQERAVSTAHLARARVGMVSTGAPGGIAEGDSLIDDAFAGRLFDAVLCNPPFNQKAWGIEQLAYDERWAYGVPPRVESELAWIQHCLAHTRPGGRVVVLMPPAAASRPSGRRIRRELLRRGALRAVVGLPVGAAAPVHVGLHLWVLEQPASMAAEPRVLFVDTAIGTGETTEGDGDGRRPIEWEKARGAVGDTWRTFLDEPGGAEDVPGFCRTVSVIELLDDSVDLTPGRHLPLAVPEVNAEEARIRAGKVRRRTLRALERACSTVPGQDWGERAAEEWRMVTVADLARSGALVLHRAPTAASGLTSSEEEAEGTGPRVLTLGDVLGDREPSGRLAEGSGDTGGSGGAGNAGDAGEPDTRVEIRAGDVVAPSTLARRDLSRARVATDTDAGALLGLNLHLLRPDPAHIDTWFLAGFLDDEDNLRRAGQGSTIVRVDLRRLRLPLLSLDEQRRYGAAFRELHDFRAELRRAQEVAADLGERLSSGLRSGLLAPPSPPPAEQDTELPHIGQT